MMQTFEPDSSLLCQTLLLEDEQATFALGRALHDVAHHTRFVGLVGPLGAGKTTLMKGLVESFGLSKDDVTSPTYTLVNEYEGDARLRIAHMDLYRLEHVDDLEGIGYWDYLDDPETIVCVEWFNTLPEAWPNRGCVIVLEPHQSQRLATIYAQNQEHLNQIMEAVRHHGSQA